MLRLPLTASWWLLALMGLGSGAGGTACGVGEAGEGVGCHGGRACALVSGTFGTRYLSILTGCSLFILYRVVSGTVRSWRFNIGHRVPKGCLSRPEAERFGPGATRADAPSFTHVERVWGTEGFSVATVSLTAKAGSGKRAYRMKRP